MRRKVIQDFANVFSQKFIQLPSGYDIASFVYYGSGTYYMNILEEVCFYNETKIPLLETCKEHKQWLVTQVEKHHFSINDIQHAHLEVKIVVSKIKIEKQYHHCFGLANFSFDCNSKFETNEKTYTSHQFHQQKWGFQWVDKQRYRTLEKLAKR